MPKRELKPGEFICPKCEGKGELDGGVFIHKVCKKCGGSGIVDWVSNATESQKDENLFSFSHDDMVYSSNAVRSYIDQKYTVSDDVLDSLAKQLADNIDDEIINKVVRSSMQAEEQNLKQWLVSKGEDIDNGIIS